VLRSVPKKNDGAPYDLARLRRDLADLLDPAVPPP
jgi:hypothetical protein